MSDKPVLPANEQLRMLFDTFPGMIWISEMDNQYSYFNKNWLEFRGRTLQQEMDGSWKRDIHPADQHQYEKQYTESFHSVLPFEVKYRIKQFNGEYRWVLTKGSPQFDDTGNLSGYIASSVDIHELTEEMSLRDEFITSASHELKIPVTTIKVYAQLLEDFFDREGDEKHVDFLKKVNKQVVKLTRLINNLAEANQLHHTGIILKKSSFDFNKLMMEEISRAQEETFKHNIQFKGYTSQNVYGDRDRLAQAFTNVLDNAIKFSPEADTIEVFLTENESGLTVSVRDFGIGINKNEKENIFKRFYRVHDNTANTFPGVGLGLYISSQIIKQHGGEIKVESRNPGSDFKFTLPYDNRT